MCITKKNYKFISLCETTEGYPTLLLKNVSLSAIATFPSTYLCAGSFINIQDIYIIFNLVEININL